MKSSIFIFGFFIILCGQFQNLNTAPISDSLLSHSVVLTFFNISLDQWQNQSKNSIMQEIIANLTTDYCQANSNECDLSMSTVFKAENVKTANSYPKTDKDQKNLETLIHVEIPTTNGGTPKKMIPGGTLLTIISNEKLRLGSGIGRDLESIKSGHTLSSSDDTKKVNNKMNKVMIPIAFMLLLLIALICWMLHRGRKKKLAREELRKYNALQNSKNAPNLREKHGAMVNTADNVPPVEFQPERGPSPDLEAPENQAEVNNNIRRHKKRRTLPKKQPIRKAPTDESDDVFEDDPDEREKPKKKGRRRKGRRSYDLNQDYEMQATKKSSCSQASSVGTNEDCQVNEGYQQDSEKGETDPARNSNTDSAVDLSSSIASSANQGRARSLPPIPRARQQETV